MSRLGVIAIGAACAFAFMGCSSLPEVSVGGAPPRVTAVDHRPGETASPAPSPKPEPTPSVTESAAAETPTPAPTTSASEPSPTATCPGGITLPPGIDPTACLPVSGPTTAFSSFKTPSGDAGCSVTEGQLTCTANETVLASDIDDPNVRCDGYTLGGDVEYACHGDVPGWMETSVTLPYDEVAVNGDHACRVTKSGLTCWNTVTGHGFFLSRSAYDQW